jgi:hypothetical protein
MGALEAIFLGLVQGLTEFWPISSRGSGGGVADASVCVFSRVITDQASEFAGIAMTGRSPEAASKMGLRRDRRGRPERPCCSSRKARFNSDS